MKRVLRRLAGATLRCHHPCRYRSSFARSSAPFVQSRESYEEVDGPEMITSIPGPRSKALIDDLNPIQESRTVHFFADYASSNGSYVMDVDGNRLLDLNCQIASLPLGYNHPAIVAALRNPNNTHLLANRPALGYCPPREFVAMLEDSLLAVAPFKMKQVMTTMCGSCSNENAFKTSFMHYMQQMRGSGSPTDEEIQTCVQNKTPGSCKLSILAFSGGFHGRSSLGALTASSSKVAFKLDLPAFDWPLAPFPQLQYPLEDHIRENREEENRCLAAVEEILDSQLRANCPVAAICVEPIQAEGGDNYASPAFFKELQRLGKAYRALLIVDEVQTGCGATGYMWAHESWQLDEPPDMVTFSKKMQTGGVYVRNGLRPKQPGRLGCTWMGDPAKLLMAVEIIDVILRDRLVDLVRVSGGELLGGLKELENSYSILSAARGMGTYCAVDLPTTEIRDDVIKALHNRGVYVIGSGVRSIRLRPALTLTPRHVGVFLDILDGVLADF